MQEATTEGHRAMALALFQDGKYEDAAREFRTELDERENNENWNDWAAAETLCGRANSAMAGFTRAQQLDSGNTGGTRQSTGIVAAVREAVGGREEPGGKAR